MILLFAFASYGQKHKTTKQNTKAEWTVLTTKYGSLKTKSSKYEIIFPSKKSKDHYIKTAEGKMLKIGDDIKIGFEDHNQQPTAQDGNIISASQDVTFSDGGNTVTITTSTTVDNGDGTKTTNSTSKTIDSSGNSNTEVTTSTESLGDGNTIIVVVEK